MRILAAASIAAALVGAGPASAASGDNLVAAAKAKGHVVYLDFWASWCGPCKLSFPYMNQVAAEFRSQGLELIAVNVDHDRKSGEAFAQKYGQSLEIAYDSNGELAKKYKVQGMPTSILIGRDGRVRYVHQGFFADKTQQYRSEIQELLNEK